MTLFTLIDRLSDNDIFAMPFDSYTITLVKYNHKETADYLPGMVSIGQVEYDHIDDAVTNPHIDMDNDTLTDADKALLKEVFNL